MREKHLIGGDGQADIEKAIVIPAKGKILCLLKFLQYEEFIAYMSIESEGIVLLQLISEQDTECNRRKDKRTKLIKIGDSHEKAAFALGHSDCDSDTQFNGANMCHSGDAGVG